jgi:hypothetical protein
MSGIGVPSRGDFRSPAFAEKLGQSPESDAERRLSFGNTRRTSANLEQNRPCAHHRDIAAAHEFLVHAFGFVANVHQV